LTVLHSPAQVRVDPAGLASIRVANPELLAPLARAVHNGKCPACQAPVHGFLDSSEEGSPQVQITCFGDPAHVFYFDATTGHIDNQPSAMGEVRP
jgi:hypothetical protein